jgi:uncharacterized protein (TIGR03032 family)
MLWRFENALRADEITPTGNDRKFGGRAASPAAQTSMTSPWARLMARGHRFSSTRCFLAATVGDTASFRPLWQPKFLSALVPEGRFHIKGLVMDGAKPAYVSAVSPSDVSDGWRERRHDGAFRDRRASDEIVANGCVIGRSAAG